MQTGLYYCQAVAIVWLATSLSTGAASQEADDDLVYIKEVDGPVKLAGLGQSSPTQNSSVVRVEFEFLSHKFSLGKLKKFLNQSHKQSQEFDIGQSKPNISSATTTTTTTTIATTTVSAVTILAPVVANSSEATARPETTVSSSWSTTNSTPDTSTPGTQTTKPPADNSNNNSSEPVPDPDASSLPVGAKIIRAGNQIACGEANPGGKSNKRLVSERIIGGGKTEPGEFPFQVRLNIRTKRGSGICGGVIIGDRHILTAAHCMTACASQYLTTATIEATGVQATIGDHSIKSDDGEIDLNIVEIKPHEKYDACNFYANDHDIAVIKTSEKISYKFTSDGYGSINRPCMPANETVYKEGEPVIVSGWGVTRENSGSLSNILRYVQVPLVNVTRCQETYGSRVTNYHVCAGYQAGGKDSCQGDSGGPLVRITDNRYELVGIVSFGYGCGQPGAPGVYTRVGGYMDWISANM